MAEKVNIVCCTDGIFPHAVGGMQRHSRLLIDALSNNHQANIVVIHPHRGVNIFPNPNVVEETIPPIDSTKNYLRECYLYSMRVSAILDKYPGYAVYSQGLSVWFHIGKYTNRLVVNPHGLEPFQGLSIKDKLIAIPFRWVFHYIFRRARKVVSLGGKLTGLLSRMVPSEKMVTLPNAVNIPEETKGWERTFDASQLRIFFLARFASNKGIHLLMQAVKELNQEGYADKITYHLGGKGPLWQHYRDRNTCENVSFPGFIEDNELGEHFKRADVFVFPTLFEGMPTVILEAMSYKLPIIATDVGGIPELVKPDNGFLIPKNDVEAIKRAILQFYRLSPQEKKAMSEASYSRVCEGFTWDKVAAAHLKLFETIVHSNA